MAEEKMIGKLKFHQAKDKLRRMVHLKYYKLAGENICSGCGQPVESIEEMTTEHIIPWRNKPTEEAKKLISDPNNICLRHPQCNLTETISSSGYRGVYYTPSSKLRPWRSRVKANKESEYLGYWPTKEQAAIRRDLYGMQYYNGKFCLNFEYLREKYQEILVNNNLDLEDVNAVETLLGRKIQ